MSELEDYPEPAFWEGHQPGVRFADAPIGSRDFFALVEQQRYALEPHIHGIVRWDSWRGSDVLEVGCGIGTDAVQFARAGAHYTGVDMTSSALEMASRRFELEGLSGRFERARATSLPFDGGRFDLVYSHGVVHHIDDPGLAVEEFRRVLRPGGTAIVMVYHRNSFNYYVTIMLVRRMLSTLLLLPGGTSAVQAVTRERAEILEGHRSLLRRHGARYLLDSELFLSNNTDGPGNPLSRVYSRAEALRLFTRYRQASAQVRYLNLRLYPGGAPVANTRIAGALERHVGWHLYVEAMK
jgi:2-polyprenyl-3-methyl-5-hydroxy-6-metoxy-1,4-benzoquinol methylase